MQANTITLSVDELNDGVTTVDVNYVYTRFDEYQNRSVYVAENHTLLNRNTMSLYRTLPKSSGNFRGTAKSAAKFTQDINVTGVDGVSILTAPILIEVSLSVPVGATPAQTKVARQKMISLLDSDNVIAPLVDQLLI